jgi:hypothetical protein
MPDNIELKKPSTWVSEIEKIPNHEAGNKLSTIIMAIEMSEKWLEANRKDMNTAIGDKEYIAFSTLSKMPAQLLQKRVGADLTNDQRLSLAQNIKLLLEKKIGTSVEAYLNAVYLLAIGAKGQGAEKVHSEALPFMLKNFALHEGGIETASIRKMAKNYLDFVFKPENIQLVPKKTLTDAKEALQEDVKREKRRKEQYSLEGWKEQAEQSEIRINTRERYLQAIDADVSRREKAPEKQKMPL